MSTDTQNNAPVSAEPVLRIGTDRNGELAIFTPRFNSVIARFTPCGKSGMKEGLLYAAPVAAQAQPAIRVVFSGEAPKLTFVEVEDGNGRSINIGRWIKRNDGLSELVLDGFACQAQQPVSGDDGLRVVLEEIHDWMDSQADAQSKGCHATFDLMILRELRDKAKFALDHLPDATKMVEPSGNSGELPDLTIQWHDTPEAVHRLFWEKAALENGMTYEELIEGTMVGETEHREKVELTYEQEIQAIRDQKCWGCADTETNQIHVWAAPDVDRTLLIHMLAHEIGHLTCEPHTDDIQEELRAETFGKAAAMAYQMLQAQQDSLQAEVLDMVRMLEANEWADHCGQTELGKRLEWAITALQNQPQNIPEIITEPGQQDDDQITKDQYRRMFQAACVELGTINEALGLDPNDGGAAPILATIEQLRTQQDADKVDVALAEMVHAMFRSANSIPVTRITIDRKQYEAAIDAARKESSDA